MSSGPWSRDQLAAVSAVDLVALAGIVSAAAIARGEKTTSAAIGWLMVSLLALGISGLAHAMFLLRSRRDIAFAVRRVVDRRDFPRGTAAAPATLPARELVAVAGSARYHRQDCAFVAGRAAEPVRLDGSEGHEPCEVCAP